MSVDGVLQTDPSSGTTTFSASGYGGVSTVANGPQRVRITVAAGSSHNVVITTTSTTATTFIAWDYVASPLPSSTSCVVMRNAGAAFDYSGWTSAIAAAVVSQARTALSTVADGSTNPVGTVVGGVGQTFSPVYGAGATQQYHPRDAGHLAMEQQALAAMVANNYVVATLDAGMPDEENIPDSRLLQWTDPYNPTISTTWGLAYRNLNYNNNYQTYGVLLYGGMTSGAFGWRIGSGNYPVSGSGAYFAHFVPSSGRYCIQTFTTANSTAESNFVNKWSCDASGNTVQSGTMASGAASGGFNAPLFTPSSSTTVGTIGQIAWDANYIYICVSANSWKRVALATF